MMLNVTVKCIGALQIHAVTGGNQRITVLVLLLGLISSGINVYAIIKQTYVSLNCLEETIAGCVYVDIPVAVDHQLIIATGVTLIASDLVVISVIWFKTYGIYRTARELGILHSLVAILLRFAAIHFVLLFLLNVLQTSIKVTKMCSVSWLSDYCHSVGYVMYFITPMSSILASRLVLTLRQYTECRWSQWATSQSSHPSKITWPSIAIQVTQETIKDGSMGRRETITSAETAMSPSLKIENVDLDLVEALRMSPTDTCFHDSHGNYRIDENSSIVEIWKVDDEMY